MPMLALANRLHGVAGAIYAALLIVGIFSAGLSSQSAMSEYLMQRFSAKKRFIIPVTLLTSLVAFGFALFGFQELIGILYPIFGYIGFVPLGLLFVHAAVFYRKRRRQRADKH